MWHRAALTQLIKAPVRGYLADDTAAAEPTALSALALAVHGAAEPARRAAGWLAETQAPDGSVSVRRDADGPRWPTSLAVLAWQAVDPELFSEAIGRAVSWMLDTRGRTHGRSPEIHHDPTLVAWPWVAGTHAWVEPTALHVLALKATGHDQHWRVREAVRMLVDRQIPGGGCNYGNTGVLGQLLRPHVQPTGIALWALRGETLGADRTAESAAWLERALRQGATATSLAWGMLGLRAQRRQHRWPPSDAAAWIARAEARNHASGRSAYKSALLLLASAAVSGAEFSIGKLHGPTAAASANAVEEIQR